jgi:hypothetical protein
MIVDRKTFITIMVNVLVNSPYESGYDASILFMPETDPVLNPKKQPPAKWFICCPIIRDLYNIKKEYWDWCDENLSGAIYCYAESDIEQWWGFEKKEDIFLWSLRWL